MYLARTSSGCLILFKDKPTKKKIVINPDFPKYREEVITWEIKGEPYPCGWFVIKDDTYPEVTFENSPVEVKLEIQF